jgi:hypothetical protein
MMMPATNNAGHDDREQRVGADTDPAEPGGQRRRTEQREHGGNQNRRTEGKRKAEVLGFLQEEVDREGAEAEQDADRVASGGEPAECGEQQTTERDGTGPAQGAGVEQHVGIDRAVARLILDEAGDG